MPLNSVPGGVFPATRRVLIGEDRAARGLRASRSGASPEYSKGEAPARMPECSGGVRAARASGPLGGARARASGRRPLGGRRRRASRQARARVWAGSLAGGAREVARSAGERDAGGPVKMREP